MANPIIHKEVLTSLRTGKAVVMQAMYLLAMAGLIWLYWPADGLQDVGGQTAKKILSVMAIGQLAMVALFAPAFTAASLTFEKENRSLESLFSTKLRPLEIVLGKMAGSLAFIVLVVLSGAPALVAPMWLGGVTLGETLTVLGLLILTAVYLGAIGLLISAFMHRSYRAIIATYAVLLVVFFLLATPAWPVSRHLILQCPPWGQTLLHTLCSLSPLEAMISVVWPDSAYAQGSPHMPAFWQMHIPIAVGAILVITAVLQWKLSRPFIPPRPREALRVRERDGKITARSFLFLIDPTKRKRMIRWWQNPVLIKEFRTRPMLQPHRLLRVGVICLVSSFLLAVFVMGGVMAMSAESGVTVTQVGGKAVEQVSMVPSIATAVSGLMVVIVILLGPAMSGGAISSDREYGIWELIRTTRLNSWRLASGKFQASIIPLLLVVASMMPALLLLLVIEPSMWLSLLKVLAVVGMNVFFVSTAGTFFSSMFPRTATATAWTYGLVVAMGLMTLLTILGEGVFAHRFVEAIYVLNPLAAVMEAAGSTMMQKYSLFVPHLKVLGLAGVAMLAVTVFRVHQLRRPD